MAAPKVSFLWRFHFDFAPNYRSVCMQRPSKRVKSGQATGITWPMLGWGENLFLGGKLNVFYSLGASNMLM